MCSILVDQLLLLLLDSESRDLVYSSCGVLINLTADHMYRSILANNATVGKSVMYPLCDPHAPIDRQTDTHTHTHTHTRTHARTHTHAHTHTHTHIHIMLIIRDIVLLTG